MTTPIDRAAEAMSAHWRDIHTNESLGKQKMLARAVFESIDREGLASAISEALKWTRNGRLFPGDMAEAILTYLTGDKP